MSRIACIEVLERLRAANPAYYQAEVQPNLARILPIDRKPLGGLTRFPAGQDPNELLKDRFLCRGGTLLFAGPTGIGKSSLTMQALIQWALGRDLFGVQPARPLRSLLIQAENDEGDLAEMRDGVLYGLSLPQDERKQALDSVDVISEDSTTGEAFAAFLDKALTERGADLVVVDPVFAFLGGDASQQKEVSPWLRNQLLPVVHAHNVGLVLIHHTNKPRTGEEKSTWQAGDFAYLGAGSAEWANFARCVLALRSLGSPTVFELIAGKRGRRLGWTDDAGGPIEARYVAHALQPGEIWWREPSKDEIASECGPDSDDASVSALEAYRKILQSSQEATQADVIRQLSRKGTAAEPNPWGLSERSAKRAVSKAIRAGLLEDTGRKSSPHGRKSAILAECEKAKSVYPL